jgi:hypothetical protein
MTNITRLALHHLEQLLGFIYLWRTDGHSPSGTVHRHWHWILWLDMRLHITHILDKALHTKKYMVTSNQVILKLSII